MVPYDARASLILSRLINVWLSESSRQLDFQPPPIAIPRWTRLFIQDGLGDRP